MLFLEVKCLGRDSGWEGVPHLPQAYSRGAGAAGLTTNRSLPHMAPSSHRRSGPGPPDTASV